METVARAVGLVQGENVRGLYFYTLGSVKCEGFVRYKSEHPGRFAAHTLKGQSQLAGFPRCPGSFLLFNCGKLISFFSVYNFYYSEFIKCANICKTFSRGGSCAPATSR